MAMNFNIDANDLITRLTEENSSNLTRALIAEATRDTIVRELENSGNLHLIQHLSADETPPQQMRPEPTPQPAPQQENTPVEHVESPSQDAVPEVYEARHYGSAEELFGEADENLETPDGN